MSESGARPPEAGGKEPEGMALCDDAAIAAAVEHLRALIRIDTTNHGDGSGNETEAARYLEKVLVEAGLAPTVLESAPGRGNLIVRLPATDPDPERGPLLLTGHLDVVPADPERWSRPPFSGDLEGGFIWGRGAVDMKGMTAMSLVSLLLLAKSDLPRRRDLILSAVADEEAGGEYGMGWLVAKHPDLLRAEYALNELGAFTLWVAGKRIYPIQCAEKGVAWMRLEATGSPGHGSIPRAESAVKTIAGAVTRLGEQQPPLRLCAPQERFVRALAEALPLPAGIAVRLASKPALAEHLIPLVFGERDRAEAFLATMRNTANPTGFQAGGKVNVLAGKASALVDGRVLPGSSTAELLDEIRTILGPLAESIKIEVQTDRPPTTVTPDTDLFRILTKTIERRDPGAKALPNMIPGYTDAVWLNKLGVKTYGFSPVWLGPDIQFAKLYHGDDERVPLDGFAWGTRCLFDVVLQAVVG